MMFPASPEKNRNRAPLLHGEFAHVGNFAAFRGSNLVGPERNPQSSAARRL